MKAYHSNSNNAKKSGGRLAVISLSVCGVLVATAIALALGLTLKEKKVQSIPVVNNPIVYVMPLQNGSTGQEFSVEKLVYNKTLNQWRTHNGVDVMGEKGQEVLAVYDGKVTGVEVTTLEGTIITIDHGQGLVAVYKGLQNATVEVDDTVEKGQKIGEIGTMMTESLEGYHVHLEMMLNGKLVDPMDYLPIKQEDK